LCEPKKIQNAKHSILGRTINADTGGMHRPKKLVYVTANDVTGGRFAAAHL
jgi:hypothetical protein